MCPCVFYVRCVRFSQMQALASLFACGQPGEPGFTPQAARCSASCKIPFRSIIKTRQISSGFYGGETGICSAFCKAVRVKYFMLCKSLRSAAKNDAPCRFLNALVQIPVVKYRKTKRTSEFACPFCLAEKQGFEPWLRSSRTTPLAGEPLRPLGYFRRSVEPI